MSEFRKAGRLRTITLVILILVALGMGYDRMRDRESQRLPDDVPAQGN